MDDNELKIRLEEIKSFENYSISLTNKVAWFILSCGLAFLYFVKDYMNLSENRIRILFVLLLFIFCVNLLFIAESRNAKKGYQKLLDDYRKSKKKKK